MREGESLMYVTESLTNVRKTIGILVHEIVSREFHLYIIIIFQICFQNNQISLLSVFSIYFLFRVCFSPKCGNESNFGRESGSRNERGPEHRLD